MLAGQCKPGSCSVHRTLCQCLVGALLQCVYSFVCLSRTRPSTNRSSRRKSREKRFAFTSCCENKPHNPRDTLPPTPCKPGSCSVHRTLRQCLVGALLQCVYSFVCLNRTRPSTNRSSRRKSREKRFAFTSCCENKPHNPRCTPLSP